jgi:LAS superfamily LD-carboxypeptidase LdcB
VAKNILKIILPLILFTLLFIAFIGYRASVKTETLRYLQIASDKVTEQQIATNKIAKEKAEKIYLMGKFDPSTEPDFARVPSIYNVGGYTMYLRKETIDAFEKMATTAKADGVNLKIVSATRNFDYQEDLWNTKWVNFSKTIPDGEKVFEKILEYSAVPGMSRHHWGTDLDINGVDPSYFDTNEGKAEYNWLVKNASSFGFCQPYNTMDANRPDGYNEEKWHWTYLPISKNLTKEYKNLITDADIKGFDGDQYVAGRNLIPYVLSINPECL